MTTALDTNARELRAANWFRRLKPLGLVAGILLALGQAGLSPASGWTEGEKKLLYIRVDFEDLRGDPISDQDASRILNEVDAYFRQVSYGKLSIKSTITPTLRMPRTAAWYETRKDGEDLNQDARSVAKAAGFETANFDLEIQVLKTKSGGDGGVGIIRGKGLWLHNNFRFGVMVHELGHNFGLPHTDLWKAWDGSIIGTGTRIHFGDSYDPMGGGGDDPRNHFSIRSKSLLGWLGPGGICDVTNSGTYKIYAQDSPSAQGVRGLRIVRDATNIYWVEFRQQISENPFMMNGARILRNYSDNNELDLLDMTPGSPLGAKDASLLLGRTFSDYEAGIHITPVRKANTTPEALEVVVNLGRFSSNHPPSLRLTASTRTANAGESVVLRADADDPDQDPVEYSWDFGDGTFEWGKPTVIHRWNETNRDFAVHCVVTDMKGGTANKLLLARIGQPMLHRIVGLVTSNGRRLEGVRVEANPTNSVLTDSDGTFALLDLKPGEYRLTAQKWGYWLKPARVTCPSPRGIELTALPLGRDTIACAEGIVLEESDRLSTPTSYRPPIEIVIVAKTDGTNLRLAYAADQVIFNWEVDHSQLRVDGGPADGKHKAGAGAIQPNQYVTIRWVVTPKRQTIFVNDGLRYEHVGDYSEIDRPVSVFPSQSRVTVKSIRVKQLPLGTQ